MTGFANDQAAVILAKDHLDPEGSVVRSGLLLAEAVLGSLEDHVHVEVILEGIKGASSSYFNVFLRRIEETRGLSTFEEVVKVETSSKIQQMVFQRSLDSLRRGPRNPTDVDKTEDPAGSRGSILRILSGWFGLKREDHGSTRERKS